MLKRIITKILLFCFFLSFVVPTGVHCDKLEELLDPKDIAALDELIANFNVPTTTNPQIDPDDIDFDLWTKTKLFSQIVLMKTKAHLKTNWKYYAGATTLFIIAGITYKTVSSGNDS